MAGRNHLPHLRKVRFIASNVAYGSVNLYSPTVRHRAAVRVPGSGVLRGKVLLVPVGRKAVTVDGLAVRAR